MDPNPSALVVGLKVWGACIGWATLTGIVAAAAYLAVELTANDTFPFEGGGLFVIAVVYGGTVGFAAGLVLGLGAGLAAGLATHTRAAPRRVVRLSQAGFVATALVIALVWRFTNSDSDRWLASWALVATVVAALAFGVWRSGRAAERAFLRPEASGPTVTF